LQLFGIQLGYNGWLMFQLESLGRHIRQTIKSRGQDYFNRKAVRILFADDDFVSAQVSGSQEYEVDIERDREALIYSCDCPFFEENFDVCKHVWATLLELQKQGHIKKWDSKPPRELLPAGPDFDDDYSDMDFEDEEDEPEALPAGRAFPPAPEGWRQLLAKVNFRENTDPNPSWPPGREIIYVVECTGQGLGADLSIQIDSRDPKKNGEWKKPRPLSLSHDLLSQLPNPADREILSRLIGVKRETWYYGPYESIYRFVPKKDDLPAIFPLISQTGRLYFRSPGNEDIRPIQWDAAGPWQFRIEVVQDEAGRQYEISAALFKEGQRIHLSQPEFFFRQGAFVQGELISSCRGAFDWISFFYRENSFFVPSAEIHQWLETMFGMPSIPPIDLPEELRMQEIEATPRPIVRIRSQKEAWGSLHLEGEMLFDYLGNVVNENQPAAGIVLISERRWLLRNIEAEKSALNKLEETGFKWKRDYTGRSFWTIAQSRLPGAVRDLVTAGWLVEAEGKLFRKPDSFSLHLSSGVDWFELRGTIEYEGIQIPIPRLLSALKRKENTIRLDDGSYGMLPEEWLSKYGTLVSLGAAKGDHLRFNRSQAGFLDALLAASPEASCDELFERVRNELRGFNGVAASDPPPGFQGVLRPYQKDGLGWLHFLNRFKFGGCLADDMGLGKTIQVLALIEERRLLRTAGSADRPPPSLVVMPRSLIFNWRQEAERFTPAIRILDHTGGERVRGYEHFDDYDVIFTTYGTLRRDACFFKEKTFDYIILDEAQAIKNATTESAKAARLLQGHYRLALSGTPIENHIGELWSLFEFLNPGMLGTASVFKGTAGKIDEQEQTLLAQALRPFILRRTKAQVAQDLPEKLEQTLFCELEDSQRALYNELRDHYRNTLLKRIEQEGIQKSKIHVLEALLRLRQAAIHPGLVDRARSHEPSAKLDMLLPQLSEVLEEGHKALVFSQFTSMLGILRERLDEDGIAYEYLDGQTQDRAGPVERFQKNPDSKLFLISLKAGGLGLNLTAAEYVYLLDPWWNPAVEAQAIDRTHRIGQTRSVFAYRLIAKDTVEEKVLALQETKRKIAESIISEDNSVLRDLRPEDLEILLS
jgi:superfamily II DNA or RNA helicase